MIRLLLSIALLWGACSVLVSLWAGHFLWKNRIRGERPRMVLRKDM